MVAAGGSATINGVVFQMLGSLDRITELYIETVADAEHQRGVLILEPEGGGGDIQIHIPSEIVVEQWKAKSTGGTWSLWDVVDKVLPDLYQAIPDDLSEANVREYRFVTEGRIGDWTVARDFFLSLSLVVPEGSLDGLDSSRRQRFARGEECTELELFKKIQSRLQVILAKRERRKMRTDSGELIGRRLRYLLPRFRLEEGVQSDELKARIERRLLDLVGEASRVCAIREQLCGALAQLSLSGGPVRPAEVLSRAGLDVVPLSNLSRLHVETIEYLRRLEGWFKYDRDLDIRRPINWPPEKPVLAVVGESGVGKSWRLVGTAHAASSRPGQFVVLLEFEDSPRATIAEAEKVLWRTVLKRSDAPPLAEIPRRIKELREDVLDPGVTVIVDRVPTKETARALVREAGLAPGVRLVLATTTEIGTGLAKDFESLVEVDWLSDFTPAQVRRCFELRGRDGTAVPPDVAMTLVRPLLTQMYLGIDAGDTWQPTTEYLLYEAYWGRVDTPDVFGATSRLAELAVSLLDGDVEYPWTLRQILDTGIDDRCRLHLESVGWLKRTQNERLEIGHDRLLNWAVAEGLLRRWRDDKVPATEVAEAISHRGSRSRLNRSLAYVELDVLWLASRPDNGCQNVLWQLIEALEGQCNLKEYYQDSLATLGPDILPAMERLVSTGADVDGWNRRERPVAAAMLEIAKLNRPSVAACCHRMLCDPRESLQDVAILVLEHLPDGDALDQLWSLGEIARSRSGEAPTNPEYYRRTRTSSALSSCVGSDPSWLRGRIRAEQDPVVLRRLLSLLEAVGASEAGVIWLSVKERAFELVPPTTGATLARCVARFRDEAEVTRLLSWLRGPLRTADIVQQRAVGRVVTATLSALARLDPDAVVAEINSMHIESVLLWTGDWLDVILGHRPVEAQAALLARIRANINFSDLYGRQPDRMDAATLDYLLSNLCHQITVDLATREAGGDSDISFGLLRLVTKINRLELLERIRAHRGKSLESALTELALQRRPRGWSPASSFDACRHLLVVIAGEGITELSNALLVGPSHAVLSGLETALIRPSSRTLEILRALALCKRDDCSGTTRRVRKRVGEALAALGEEEKLIKAVLRFEDGFTRRMARRLPESPAAHDGAYERAIDATESRWLKRKIAGALCLGTSRRAEFAQYLIPLLEQEEPLPLIAVRMLLDLGAEDQGTTAALQSYFASGEPRAVEAGAALVWMAGAAGKEAAMISIERAVAARGTGFLTPDERWVALQLWEADGFRLRAAEILWDHLRTSKRFDRLGRELLAIADVEDDAEVDEFLRERAFANGEFMGPHPYYPIMGLAKRDPDLAFRNCLRRLGREREEREWIPETMIEIDVDQAVPVLCDHMRSEISVALQLAIGRALRWCPDGDEVDKRIADMAKSEDAASRTAAFRIAGWRPGVLERELRVARDSEMDLTARSAASQALYRRQREIWAKELIKSCPPAPAPERWGTVAAIMALADPEVAWRRGDDLDIGQVIAQNDDALWDFADSLKGKRLKKLTDETERNDRDRHV